jgi:DNA-binding GntR family transcriptional regulator
MIDAIGRSGGHDMTTRVTATSIVDAVAENLRERLFQRTLADGGNVTEADVALYYDVARPTAKAAIERLVSEGLLIRTIHRTARIPTLGPDEVNDIYRTRIHLEGETVRQLAELRLVPPDAREANGRVLASSDGETLAVVGPDLEFHSILMDALGSARLSRMYGSLVQDVRMCMSQVQGRNLLRVVDIAKEHGEILDAIEAGDGEKAKLLLAEHLTRARDRLTESLSSTERAQSERRDSN